MGQLRRILHKYQKVYVGFLSKSASNLFKDALTASGIAGTQVLTIFGFIDVRVYPNDAGGELIAARASLVIQQNA